MQIIVHRQVVAAVQKLAADAKFTFTGESTVGEPIGDLAVVDKVNWNVTPMQHNEYCIVVDDKVVLTLIEFYVECVGLMVPIITAIKRFGGIAEAYDKRLRRLLA
jgi:hypothetical protein